MYLTLLKSLKGLDDKERDSKTIRRYVVRKKAKSP